MFFLSVFVAAASAAAILFELLSPYFDSDRRALRRRLAKDSARPAGDATRLYQDLEQLDKELAEERATPSARMPAHAKPRELNVNALMRKFLESAGVSISPLQTIVVMMLTGLFCAWICRWIFGRFGLPIGFVVGMGLPIAAIEYLRRVRRERLLNQLGGAFELMARVVRTGQTTTESMRAVSESFGDPLAGEIAQCVHQIEMGLSPDEAFRDLGRNSDVMELRIFGVAMKIHRQTGGNLSEILDRLAAMIRARLRLRQKIRGLTAEGRLQSLILILLPPLAFAVMMVMNRKYAETLLEHTRLLTMTGALMIVGILWIRRIVNFQS